jgi:hypothetical protein
LAWIIESEIRKELRAPKRERDLPFDVTSEDAERRSVQSARDRPKPLLCDGLTAVARQGSGAGRFAALIRDACGMLVVDGVFRDRRPGRKWRLDPDWLFREAYMRERTCEAIAAEARCPPRNVIEAIRRLSRRLQDRLLTVLAIPPEVVAAIIEKAPAGDGVRDQILEGLRAFVAGEQTDPSGDNAVTR